MKVVIRLGKGEDVGGRRGRGGGRREDSEKEEREEGGEGEGRKGWRE